MQSNGEPWEAKYHRLQNKCVRDDHDTRNDMIIDIVPVDGCKVRGNPERQNIIDFKINVFEMIMTQGMIW